MNCLNCGFKIIDSIIPRQIKAQAKGFCCEGCQEGYEEIKHWELERAANDE